MGIKANTNNGKYSIKSYSPYIYRWSPTKPDYNTTKNKQITKKTICTATPGSQGEDFNTSYCYNLGVSPEGAQQRLAYVACDYVK